jgi:hypothetical protein
MNNSKNILTVIDGVGEMINDVSKDIVKHTPQIFYLPQKNGKVEVEPWASGVLIQLSEQYFLISAGHIFDDVTPDRLGIIIKDTFQVLGGFVNYTPTKTSKENNQIDLCIWKIEENVVKKIKNVFQFLDLNKTPFDYDIINTPNYLLYGYPLSRTKKNPIKRKITPEAFCFLTKVASSNLYKNYGFETHSNVVLEYDILKIQSFGSNIIKKGPKPKGISGGGLWFIPNLLMEKGKCPIYNLVGILTEYISESDIVVATRIHLVGEILRQKFNIDIPESRITKLDT